MFTRTATYKPDVNFFLTTPEKNASASKKCKDYSTFGATMPGRQFNSGNYRYGFNGKENDNEVKGNGNQQDYGMRIYDPRIGKFLSVDPLFKSFAWNSPYAFAENDVIRSIDLDGAEKSFRFLQKNEDGSSTIVKEVKYSDVFPGKAHGPLGAGTFDSYYNEKLKKYGDGVYRQTFNEAHPIRSTALDVEKRYQDTKGLIQLGDDVAPVLQESGKWAKRIGIGAQASANPIIMAAGAELYQLGEALETSGDIIDISCTYAKGDEKGVVKKIAIMVAGKIGGAVIGAGASDKDAKVAGELLDEGLDAVFDSNNSNQSSQDSKSLIKEN